VTSVAECQQVLVSVRDAARMLGVCERTIFSLTKTGVLEKVRIGKRGVRFRREDLERFGNRLPSVA
jgi:excisionase family DNA binding protein